MKGLVIASVLFMFVVVPASAAVTETAVNPVNGHTYYLLSQNTWTDAEAEAVSLGGHLATVRNAQENDFIYATFSAPQNRTLWIGLNNFALAGFVWSSGEAVSYTNWNLGEPNFPDSQPTVMMYPLVFPNSTPAMAGTWDDWLDDTTAWYSDPVYGVAEVVPEPAMLSLLALGGLALVRRRR
jgi:MYXO-CTERM domain-containing protein